MADFSPSKNFIQNTAAPLHVAYMAKQVGVPRYIYAGSASVYGQMPGLLTEDAPVAPSYPYGISKLAGERAVLQLADSSFQVIAFRKGTVCGWSPRMRFDLCINAMYKDAKTKGVVTVNAGQVHRPILSMRNAVIAYTFAVETSIFSSIHNIFSHNYRMDQAGWMVATQTGAKLIINQGAEKRDYQLAGTGWGDAVTDIVNELEQHCGTWTPEQFEDDRWYNIRLFRR
jgi:nucleoside-diphosphate-sugar epimerase